MRRIVLVLVVCALALRCTAALAATGSLTYQARVIHDNRNQLSFVSGSIDLASAAYSERVERSFVLNWRRLPGQLEATRPALPAIWQANGRTAQRLDGALPRYDSPLLRHFVVGRVVSGQRLEPGETYLSDQLVITTAAYDRGSFEIVAEFRGLPLVIVGRTAERGGRELVKDLAVLGPASELYQYFFDEIEYSAQPLESPPALPAFDPARYVTWPSDGPQPVAIRPVKDWLVFRAHLPNGRPLNLVFDSGAEQMILDELVLKVDALLEPVGTARVAGAIASGEMNLYEGFSFVAGGVHFDNLQVIGTQLTTLGIGADMRIHGIVGGEMLQLCRLDIDLAEGVMTLAPPSAPGERSGQQLPLTFISDMPHVEAEVHDTGRALLMLDTGQRTELSVNLDWLDTYELGEQLKLNGFLGGVAGGLQPRYIVENVDLSLGGQTYHQNAADAGMAATFSFNGVPVVGSIGFPLLARHYGGVTFDYSNKLLYLRDPAEERIFAGRPEAWDAPFEGQPLRLAGRGDDEGVRPEEREDYEYAVAAVTQRDVDDPLGLVNSAARLWRWDRGEGFYGWTAESDPRYQRIELPDSSRYNEEARAEDRRRDQAQQAAARPAVDPEPAVPVPPVAEPEPLLDLPRETAPEPAIVEPPEVLPEPEPEPQPPPEVPAQLTLPPLPPVRERVLGLGAVIRGLAAATLEALAERAQAAAEQPPDEPDEEPQEEAEPVYASGLGGSDKREDYQFRRGAGKLHFK